MKKPSIDDLIFTRLFALRKDTDPHDWKTHVRRNLVPEVRAETMRFFGPTDCLEAQYPGLDYNKTRHRHRLSQYPFHKRLFRIFDELRLVDSEIQSLCKWEGTRWAREHFQKTNGTIIIDTTWDGVADFRRSLTSAAQISLRGGHVGSRDLSEMAESGEEEESVDADAAGDTGAERVGEKELSDEESEDEIMQQSVGVELNQRLLAATEARARGEDVVIDADWEQWLKEAAERGIHPGISGSAGSTSGAMGTREQLHWGREVPRYLNDDPTPEIAAIQASLPPPPDYFPGRRTSNLATSVVLPPIVRRTGTAP